MIFVAGGLIWKSQAGATAEGGYNLSSAFSFDTDTADTDYEQTYAVANRGANDSASNGDAAATKATRSTNDPPRSDTFGPEYAFATSGGTGSAWDWDDSGNSLHVKQTDVATKVSTTSGLLRAKHKTPKTTVKQPK